MHSGLSQRGLPWLTSPDAGAVLGDPGQHLARDPVLRDHAAGRAADHPGGALRGRRPSTAPGRWQRFRHVTLPLLLPILLITLVLSIIWTFSDFQIVYGLTDGGPMNSTHVLATLSYQVGLASGNIGEGAAISLTMLPLLLVLIVWQIRAACVAGAAGADPAAGRGIERALFVYVPLGLRPPVPAGALLLDGRSPRSSRTPSCTTRRGSPLFVATPTLEHFEYLLHEDRVPASGPGTR